MSRGIKKFRVSSEEWEIIKRNAEKAGMKPCTYVRRIALDGIIKKYDMRLVNDVRIAFIKIGTNINQIATVVNSSKTIYDADMKNLKKEFYELNDIVRNWLKPL